MADTLVFIPAWNEEANLPAVLAELHGELPDADVLVVDDGSTDRTAEVAREHGAEVLSFGENRGLQAGIAAGYSWANEHGYAFCGRVDADGQHPAAELRRLLELVRADEADVAVGSRFVSGPGYEPYRYEAEGIRKLGTGLLRRSMRVALGRPFNDATSGLYAASAKALPALAKPYTSGAAGGGPADGRGRGRRSPLRLVAAAAPAVRGGADAPRVARPGDAAACRRRCTDDRGQRARGGRRRGRARRGRGGARHLLLARAAGAPARARPAAGARPSERGDDSTHPAAPADRAGARDTPPLEARRASQAAVSASTDFAVCSRFSASSQTALRGP